ncbi:MAG TPA: site-2 protease family protein [Thermomicrobiales bacterium]|nr:site-2 protease family protein [Thermomicrobiales bacterium]
MPLGLHFDATTFAAGLLAFVVAITLHEFMHAFVAYQLGDPTAARLGRITLNPVAHFDPFGFLMLVFLLVGGFGLAWGRPVPVNPGNFRNPKRGMLLTAAAGPLSNVVQAAVFSIPLWVAPRAVESWPPFALDLVRELVLINVLLAAFNVIPIPPLDGHKILTGLLPDFWYPILAPLERNGFLVLLILIFVPAFLPGPFRVDILGGIFGPVAEVLQRFIIPAGFR